MSSATLSGEEICDYFESLPDGRRELVWVRLRNLTDFDFEDPEADGFDIDDEIWEQIVTDMWVSDQLNRLVAMGVLTTEAATQDGKLIYRSA